MSRETVLALCLTAVAACASPAPTAPAKAPESGIDFAAFDKAVRPQDDLFQLGRFAVSESDTPTMLAAKLSGWYPQLAAAGKKLVSPFGKLARLASFDTVLARRAPSQP